MKKAVSRLYPNISDFSDATREHDNCSVGGTASLTGEPSYRIVYMSLKALATTDPRIGMAADIEMGPDGTLLGTSDGVGIMTQIPQRLFKEAYTAGENRDVLCDPKTGQERDLGAGVFFLPHDSQLAKECENIVKAALKDSGYSEYKWRTTPVSLDQLGRLGRDTCPVSKQLMILPKSKQDKDAFDKELYFVQRDIESRMWEKGIGPDDFYICSIGARTIVYKGLPLAHRFSDFYPDLKNPKFETAVALFHGRYATNTAPAAWRAHVKRMLGHNGEINTLRGNINAMYKLENIFGAVFGEQKDLILKNLLNTKGSDSDILDNALQFLYHAGVSLPLIKTLLVPPAMRSGAPISYDESLMNKFTSTLSPGWEGPGMFGTFDGKMMVFFGDLNSMRPTPSEIFGSKETPHIPDLLVVGSESGMVNNIIAAGSRYNKLTNNFNGEEHGDLQDLSIERNTLPPGNMIGVNIDPDNMIAGEKVPVGFLGNNYLRQLAVKDAQRIFDFREHVKSIQNIQRAMPSENDFPYAAEVA